ncbi:MAG: hypothetical protein MUC63_08785 [Planctomycetes bacterium]|jgi:hypothetical protein|nr:hypothetical protein [Planctomycetota bacterium]
MRRKAAVLVLAGLALGLASGCHALDTFNLYPRISVLDFVVTPGKEGRVQPQALVELKDASIRWLQNGGLFSQVGEDASGGPETVFVQGTVYNYRAHSTGRAFASAFSGIDFSGESLIFYRFYDSTGRTLLEKYVQAKYVQAPPGINPTSEAAGCEFARLVSWHKNIRS